MPRTPQITRNDTGALWGPSCAEYGHFGPKVGFIGSSGDCGQKGSCPSHHLYEARSQTMGKAQKGSNRLLLQGILAKSLRALL